MAVKLDTLFVLPKDIEWFELPLLLIPVFVLLLLVLHNADIDDNIEGSIDNDDDEFVDGRKESVVAPIIFSDGVEVEEELTVEEKMDELPSKL